MSMPKLGIFWIIDGEIVSFTVPLNRAEHIGGFANYRHGHVHLWPFVQRMLPHFRNTPYEGLPRGRVTHVIRENVFNVLLPTYELHNHRLATRVFARFDLHPSLTRIVGDEHYDCDCRTML